MKKNIELKYYCPDFKKIRIILNKINAKKDTIKKQTDYFFDISNKSNKSFARLKLRVEKNSNTLIYYERPDFIANKTTSSLVKLYKINDKDIIPFLKTFIPIKAVVRKRREVWKKDNIVFHLDNIKDIGKVFEIELQKNDKITQNDKQIFKNYQSLFMPYLGRIIKKSNIDLIVGK